MNDERERERERDGYTDYRKFRMSGEQGRRYGRQAYAGSKLAYTTVPSSIKAYSLSQFFVVSSAPAFPALVHR